MDKKPNKQGKISEPAATAKAEKNSPIKKAHSAGKTIAVFNTKGGVGKTFIVDNLALALAQNADVKVVIVDLDLHSGDACTMLNLKPKRTISDLVENIEFYAPTDIEKMLTPVNANVKIMAAPLEPEVAESIKGELIVRLINLVKEIADYVIVDTPSAFNEIVLAAIGVVDRIYLIATEDLLALKDALLSSQTLQLLDFPEEKVKFVLNRSKSVVGLTDREIEQSLGMRIWATIPSDRTVPVSMNTGLPLVIHYPRSPAARSIFRLAAHTTNSFSAEAKRKRREAA